jgi:hypothetical protein
MSAKKSTVAPKRPNAGANTPHNNASKGEKPKVGPMKPKGNQK